MTQPFHSEGYPEQVQYTYELRQVQAHSLILLFPANMTMPLTMEREAGRGRAVISTLKLNAKFGSWHTYTFF